MKPVKIISAQDAAELVQDGATLAICGCENVLTPDALLSALGQRFVRSGAPVALTELHPIIVGMGEGRGLENLAHRGMVKRAIGSGYSYLKSSKYTALLKEDAFEAHVMPMGTIFQMLRDCAAGRRRTLTRIGLSTFVDPAVEGGCMNAAAIQSLSRHVDIEGETHLAYDVVPIDVAFLRGTTADENGNISFEDEPVSLGARIMAQAAKASGGKVIVQVRRMTQSGSLHPRMVEIPGIFVDAVVVVPDQPFSGGEALNPALTGETRLPAKSVGAVPPGIARIVASRASAEVKDGETVNLGVGMPIEVPKILHERAAAPHATYFPEHGSVGGIPGDRAIFGTNINPDAIIDSTSVFDCFQGGGLDITFLGCGQIDSAGNVNVSKFNGIVPGCGGFIDIISRTPRIVFCGSFSAGGLDVMVADGDLKILTEGRHSKFVPEVEQITFSAELALQRGQQVLYVTERAVFQLSAQGLELIEIAPGVDLEQQVRRQIPFPITISDRLTKIAPQHFT
ncbi:CoA-transferase [Marinovum sp. 2_MG-2023]|uniref:CoA-transferase n=1 Tax=unclassified Marinovum TaxID=2647166 RepID=UPI0026E13B13|nr:MULTISPECIES: CoA-transferase [unclassified Marinovum]MDO6732594.1 CoA-transferase [Marinovum sp. 2_MG-2023]MDO6782089.1 CoA-transferase [Marinovum sp. 1_MG-2023]